MLRNTALILTIIGGINWGLVGAFQINLLDIIFASAPILISVTEIIVGIASLYVLYEFLIKN